MTENILRDDIELEPKALAIGGKRLEILCVKNLDPFIAEMEQAGRQDFEGFPFWVKIWEASIVLTDRMLQMDLDKNKSILELGAGMGITGLFLGAFGYRVTVTDNNHDALELVSRNAAHNGIENLQTAELDWHHPEIGKTFDIICGSELIYRKSDAEPVVNILKQLLKPEATAYLAHDISRMSMMHFMEEAEKNFHTSHKGMSFSGGGQKKQIVIHTLKKKYR
ncbi:MAG: methyltransferase domain-containing protein [Desulfobacterales bacterium]|nr:methyltransferase domain-containing protein [Desulfobacterales bacterium]